MARKLTDGLLAMTAGGDAGTLAAALAAGPASAPTGAATAETADYEAVWIETPECTTCDECVEINPHIFAYNDEDKAIIVNPRGGPYRDIVKAAEKCTAGVIHPGTPADPNEKGLDKLIKRAAKYQ